MGRGWGNVTKRGEDVTERLLTEARGEIETPPELEALKATIVERCTGPRCATYSCWRWPRSSPTGPMRTRRSR